MSSVSSVFPPLSESTVSVPPKAPKASKAKPVSEPEPERKVRKRPVRNPAGRFYVIYEDKDDGQAQRILAKFPTIGQARKHYELVARVAGVAHARAKIARFVIVE